MPTTFPALAASLLVAGTMCLALHSGAARAADGEGATSKELRVPTADLDLASPADQQILRHRLRLAARKVCSALNLGEPLTTDAFLVCYTDAAHAAMSLADERIAAAQTGTRLAEGTVHTGR